MSEVVGFVGLGSMGAHMARRLVEAGHDVLVFDLKPEAVAAAAAQGARVADSVRAVADGADIVFASLPDNDACRAVAIGPGGIVEGGRVRIFVNLGTSGSALSRELAARFGEKSIAFVDAPVTGGMRGARDGTLTIMASGPQAAFERVEPLLGHLGAHIFFVGEIVGGAQTMKLANNMLSLTAFVVTGEALAMGVKAGLDPKLMLDILNVGTGRNTATSDKYPRYILTRNFDLGSTTDVAAKDIKLAVAEAEDFGVPVGVGGATRQYFMFALSQGDGPKDYTRIVEHLENWTNTKLSSSDK